MQIRDEILARMYVILTLLCLVPLAVAIQVVRVGLLDRDQLEEAGDRQRTAVADIPAMRGTIVDDRGHTLVVNTARFDIAVDPTVSGFDAASSDLYQSLARITGTSAGVYRQRVQARSSKKYALLERGLSTSQVARLSRTAPGLRVDARHSRTYNHGSLAAHVLGHVDADLRGLAGIEAGMNSHLTGVAGSRAMNRDRRGNVRPAADGRVVLPNHGSTVVLTLDLSRQSILEEELAKGVARAGATWGTAIAMDPKTGAILAMANVPTYDPNRPGGAGSFERRNHAIVDMIEPGSTFKLVTAAAAMQAGVITMSDTVDTGPGWAVLHGRTLKDTHAYGRIPFKEVIALSSNIGSARVAERTRPEDFYRMARAFGFGMPTGIDLPGEVGGTLKRVSRWSGSTLSAMSRGYEIHATPLQVLTAYAALANGGLLMRPYVVSQVLDVTGQVEWQAEPDSIRRVFSREMARRLLPAFEAVVTDGTAKEAALDGIRVAGKTGTAWKYQNGGYSTSRSRATFVGFFPAENPTVALLVLMDEPRLSIYGGVVAAPVFRETARRWMATMDQDEPERMQWAADSIRVPDLAGMPAELVRPRLLAAGLDGPKPPKAPAVVVSQRLTPGRGTLPGTSVPVRTERATETTMPDLTGWTVREASYWLAARGVALRARGSGSVTGQTPSAGSPLPKSATITADG